MMINLSKMWTELRMSAAVKRDQVRDTLASNTVSQSLSYLTTPNVIKFGAGAKKK